MRFLDQIRSEIDSKHERAMKALTEVQSYLDDTSPVRKPSLPQTMAATARLSSAAPGMSIRAKIFQLIHDSWMTVRQIGDALGLSRRQVTGVLYGVGSRDKIDRRETSSGTEYHIKQQPAHQPSN